MSGVSSLALCSVGLVIKDDEVGGMLWLRAEVEKLSEDLDSLVQELREHCATDGIRFPSGASRIRPVLRLLARKPSKVIEEEAVKTLLSELTKFCQDNERKISSWETGCRIRSRLKTGMMRAATCLVRAAVEELAVLKTELAPLLGRPRRLDT